MNHGEIIETIPGMRLSLHIDDDPHNPREEYERLDHMFTVDDPKGSGPLADVWAECRDRTRYRRDAVTLFVRYCAQTGAAVTLVDSPPRDFDRVYYLPADQLHEVGDPHTYLKAQADEYTAWADGDVWGYVIDREVTWHRADHESTVTMITWDTVDSCWGFYGYEYAEKVAREAWQHATVS